METIPSLSGLAPNSPLPRDRASGRARMAAGYSSLGRSRAVPPLAAGTASPSAQMREERRRGGSILTASAPQPGLVQVRRRRRELRQIPTPRECRRELFPPTFEPAGLQASNSQLQALLSVPRKQRRVLSFTRLEGRSCQRLRLSYQLLGAGSRWRDGTPDREQTFQGRRGRKSLHVAWPAPSPSRATREQTYPPLPSLPPLQVTRSDFHTGVNLDRCH